MANIRILPDIIVSRIAAGEVIERPYSVVKELIENSIDASADRIDIEIKSGGKRYISVRDNGSGMSRDDAIMSLERHATSKIKDVNDIFSINTLGFRGEALPSIASISVFTLRTKVEGDLSGTEINVRGGLIKKVQDVGCPRGTSVEVGRLFYNTSPRLKFLKTVETELGRVIDIVQREAISHPDVSFELVHNGKKVLNLNRKKNQSERIYDIIPNTRLFEFRESSGESSVLGYVSSPLGSRTTTQKLFTFVNNRPVKDRFLTRMILDAYGKQIENKKYPQGVLFLQVPPSDLDVNVHPTKHEIRFRNQKIIGDLVKRSLESVLNKAPWFTVRNEGGEFMPGESFYDRTEKYERSIPHPGEMGDTHENNTLLSEQTGYYQNNTQKSHATGLDHEITEEHSITTPGSGAIFGDDKYFSGLHVVGQLRNLYIVCESGNGMVLIDQHAAHERVNYEKVKRNYNEHNTGNVQQLLIPEIIELSPGELKVLGQYRSELESIGFSAERFGSNTVRLRSVPSLLGSSGVKELFIDLINEMEETGESRSLNERLDLIFATIACHGSIRANHKLNEQQIRALFEELDMADSPFHCPHGRPVVSELTFEHLERLFRRT